MKIRGIVPFALPLCLTLAVAGPASAQKPAAPAAPSVAPSPSAKIDPAAKDLIDRMAAAYKALQSFSATVEIGGTGGNAAPARRATIAFKRPNQALVVSTDKLGETRAVADGTSLFILSPTHKTSYLKMPVSSGPEKSGIPNAISMGRAGGSGLMPALVNGANPATLLASRLQSLSVLAPEIVAGVPVDVVEAALPGPNTKEARITFAIGKDDHLLRRLAITQGGQPLEPTETYTDVKANPDLPAGEFTFTPPPGAKAVDASSPPMHDPRLKPGAQPFPIQAKDLAGKPVALDRYRGKVVLLDFWATWCGPCVGEMPNVVAAYKKFHPQGFEIIGVSLDNAPDRAKLVAFTQKNKMPWRQIFDGGGWQSAVATQYGVNAIPFTVLIGRDGTIAALDVRGEALAPAIRQALAKPVARAAH